MLLQVLEQVRKSIQKVRSKVDILEPFAVMGRPTVDLSSNFSLFGAMPKKHVFLIPPWRAKKKEKSDFEPTWCPKACPRGSPGPWGNQCYRQFDVFSIYIIFKICRWHFKCIFNTNRANKWPLGALEMLWRSSGLQWVPARPFGRFPPMISTVTDQKSIYDGASETCVSVLD